MIRTPKEIAKLSKFTRNRCGGVYKLAGLTYIDNVDGLGVEKSHADIKNRGFLGLVSLKSFQSICCSSPEEQRVQEVIEAVSSGRGVACPQVYLNIDSYMSSGHGRCLVAGFTGFNTGVALQKLGIEEMEVQFVLLGYGMRNLDGIADFFNWVGAGVHTMCGNFVRTPFNKLIVGA